MENLKKCWVFVLLLALLGGGTALLAWDLGEECVSVLTTGAGGTEYLLAASDAQGDVYALGRRGDRYQLVIGGQDGQRKESWTLAEEALGGESRPAALYPASGGAVYLGLYHNEGTETSLRLYRFTDRGRSAELLLNEPCAGATLREQMASVRLSDFAEVDSVVTFALLRGDVATFYQRTTADSGLEHLTKVSKGDLRAALALSDGTLALAAGEDLVRTDRRTIPLENGEKIIQLTQAGTGIYYVDGASLKVFYADFADWAPYSVLNLVKDAYDMDGCTDLWVTRRGEALLLMDGQRLLLDRGTSVADLSGMLYPTAAWCVLVLAGLSLAVLAATTLLWYAVCEQRRFRLPLLVRWGVLAAAVAALGVNVLIRGTVLPAGEAAARREAAGLMGASTAQVLEGRDLTDGTLPARLAENLAEAEGGLYRDAVVAVYRRDEMENWTLTNDNTGVTAGIRAELSSGFDRAQAEAAREAGSLFWSRWEGGEPHYLLYRTDGDLLLAVDVNGGNLLRESRENYRWMSQGLSALAVVLTLLTVIILTVITVGLRKALVGMERLADGDRAVRISVGGGDELASLADDLNALSGTLGDMERQQNELAQSYRRFVPERVLSLLGKTDLAQVDKQTFVSRHLAAMMLWFRFPPQVYEKSGKELFDNLNEIIERTASIVTSRGGAVFNFAYNGYDAVFEGGSAAAVSTAVAVQQEILDLNREREAAGKPQVIVRIALDEGDVMMGVVGDENQIEPTSISSSFSIAKHLVDLCGRMEANILCTEAVIDGAKGYGSRYMGKCQEGGEAIRTYEIFDGDPYEIRKVKETTGAQFSEGVYALYSRDFSRAKRIFLSLVHHSAGDGGARYYLYLADLLEKRQSEDISLDAGV